MRIALLLVVGFGLAAPAQAQDGASVVSSKHDLSVSGGGRIRAMTETQVCVFCHVGHSRKPAGDNRPDLIKDYVPYQSSTMRSSISSSPSGASRVCLSCHDGTIALGETVASGTIALLATAPGGRLPPDAPSNLGTDLRRTHPISFVPVSGGKVRPPEPGAPARLDGRGQLQCTSCHDPHREKNDPIRGMFLIGSNRYSAMCLSCHTVEYWKANPAAHQSALTPVPPGLKERYPYATVAENGCESCHRSHAGSVHGRLIRAEGDQPEQTVCLDCHNGRLAKTDLTRELAKPFAHATPPDAPRVHDPAEGPRDSRHTLPETRVSAPRHVTCVDCHNPHAAYQKPSDGLQVSGVLDGVWGIDQRGERVEQVTFEYEVCFKCHADSANQPRAAGGARSRPRRAQPNQNLRLALAPDAPSAHPILGPGRGNSPSLIAFPGGGGGDAGLPFSGSQSITCGSCHGSDTSPAAGGQGPAGPHGSIHAFLLERNLSTADHTVESPSAYALCYKCHDRERVLSPSSPFPLHRKHVVDSATPCTACHASHGVATLSSSVEGGAHLMDFDLNIVDPTPRGQLGYRALGLGAGVCSTSCHGVVHEDAAY